MQPFHSWRLRDVVHLIPAILLMLVGMLIMSIMRIVLVVTNIISHARTLIPCGDHSTFVRVVFVSHGRRQCFDLFPKVV